MMTPQEELIENAKLLIAEIDSWNLTKPESKIISKILGPVVKAREEFAWEVIYNRAFCPVCALKIIAEKSFDGIKVIEFLRDIKKIDPASDGLTYLCKEFYFTSFLTQQLSNTGVEFIQKHVMDYATLKYPSALKSEENTKNIKTLSIFFLSLNTILGEIINNIFDGFVKIVYSNFEKERRRKILTFFLSLLSTYLHQMTIAYDDTSELWAIGLNKLPEEISKVCELRDPVVIYKEYSD